MGKFRLQLDKNSKVTIQVGIFDFLNCDFRLFKNYSASILSSISTFLPPLFLK